ncbi:putative DNA packing protein [Marmot herpesvirus 1]|nr:putative DNA packing protein [Marmot herpesvirus 1]
MILNKHKQLFLDNYKKYVDTQGTSMGWKTSSPTILTNWSKSERTAHPMLGTIPAVNIYSSILGKYCHGAYSMTLPMTTPGIGNSRCIQQPTYNILEPLSQYLKCILSTPNVSNSEALTEFMASVETQRCLSENQQFNELKQFLINLSAFLNGYYRPSSVNIEPFQKQLILQTFFFIVSIKIPDATESMLNYFKSLFGIDFIDPQQLHTYKQKASVFLIPRRHGKTWIVVAIISMLLAYVENIHIGYVAHQKHVANSVFMEIIQTLLKFCPARNIEIKKENGTITYTQDGKISSTLMCATCFNKNVSKFFSIFDNYRYIF